VITGQRAPDPAADPLRPGSGQHPEPADPPKPGCNSHPDAPIADKSPLTLMTGQLPPFQPDSLPMSMLHTARRGDGSGIVGSSTSVSTFPGPRVVAWESPIFARKSQRPRLSIAATCVNRCSDFLRRLTS
jgi:hypothetical protein